MKYFLFCLLLLAGFAAANTCTEAWFEIGAYGFIYTKDHAHLDSVYFKEYDNEWTDKYIYGKDYLDYFITDPKEEGEDVRTAKFYWNSDENALSKKGYEYLGEIQYSEDTLFYSFTNYNNGKRHEQQTAKIVNNVLEAQYPDGPNGEIAFEQLYFQNDTLIKSITDYYGTDSAEVHKRIIIRDEQDDFKCLEYRNNGENFYNLEYVKNDNGYSIKIYDQNYFREFFMVYPESSTAIRKQRPAVKSSPKARYFDLLGRYKYTR